MTQIVRLQSSDDKFFDVGLDVIKQSGTVFNLVTDLGLLTGEDQIIPVPLPNVDEDTLEAVLKWCEDHKTDEPMQEETGPFEDGIGKRVEVPEKDKTFLESLSKEQLVSITQAANYLDIKLLLEYACEAFADSLIGKDVQQMREYWSIENDYTPEEEEKLKEENPWLEK